MKFNSLRLKIFFPLVFFIILFVLLQSNFFFGKLQVSVNDQVRLRARDIANTMAYLTESVQEKSELLRFVSAISAENEIESILVLKKTSNEIIASDHYELIGSTFSKEQKIFDLLHMEEAYDTKELVLVYQGKDKKILSVYMPVLLSFKNDKTQELQEGLVVFGLDTSEINTVFDQIAWNSALVALGFGVAIYILFYFLIEYFILKPNKKILTVVAKRASGQKGVYIENKSKDEIGRLSWEINKMLEIIMEQENNLVQATIDAEEASKAKSIFLANMSHEFRTPLNGIIGFTEMVAETSLSEDQAEMVNTIRLCSEGLLSLINDVLDVSKIEASEVVLEKVPFNLNQLLLESFVLVQNRIVSKVIRLVIEQPVLPGKVIGDPLRLKQIIINFLTNAAKFTEKGFVLLRLEILNQDSVEIKFRFSVQDTGIGMTQEQAVVIFDVFKQADGSTTRKYGGTGLGMSICKSLVELMGDEISLDTTIDEGSTFSFEASFGVGELLGVDYAFSEKKKCFISEGAHQHSENLLKHFKEMNVEVSSFKALSFFLNDFHEPLPATIFYDFDEIRKAYFEESDEFNQICQLNNENKIHLIVIIPYMSEKILMELRRLKITEYIVRPLWISNLKAILDRLWLLDEKKGGKHALLDSYAHNILIAEDNLINQKLLLKVLKKLGHHVTVAKNGLEAVEKSLAEKFDLIFMDMQMPVMDGLEACRKIKARGDDVPVVAMTANAFQSDKDACLDAGMIAFLAKPVRKNELSATIEKHALKGQS